MQQIGIRAWGIIPVDTDPSHGAPVGMRPPMYVAMALDRNTSLVFHLRASPARLVVELEATALTGAGRGPQPFQLATGTQMDAYRALPPTMWEARAEGMYVVFAAAVSGVADFLKITLVESRPMVINRASFHTP